MLKRFTLIELVVVIAVLGILASIVLLNINGVQNKAQIAGIESNARQLQTSVDLYLQDIGLYPSILQPTVENPQLIDFSKLVPDYLRKQPKDSANYWVDYTGRVWSSTVDAPSMMVKNEERYTWKPVNGSLYRVYEVSNCNQNCSSPQLKEVTTLEESSYEGESNKQYLFSTIDSFGLETPPVGEGYVGKIESYEPSTAPISPCDKQGYVCINTISDLKNIVSDLDGNYRLNADLDLSSEANWIPLGEDSQPFTGVFDGNGHTLSRIKTTMPLQSGLFGYMEGAEIKNLNLTQVEAKGNEDVGLLAGKARYSDIHDILITQSASTGGWKVGGLLGFSQNNTIKNISVAAKTLANKENPSYSGYDSGGIIGNDNNSTISWVYAQTKSEGYGSVGGLIGYSQSTTLEHVFGTTKATGHYITTSSDGQDIGGIIGNAQQSTVNQGTIISEVDGHFSTGGGFGYANQSKISNISINSVVKGLLKNDNLGGNDIGGFVGLLKETTIKNSFAKTQTSGYLGSVGGFVGHSEQSAIQNSTSSGTVVGQNTASDNGGYDIGGFIGSDYLSTLVGNQNTASVSGYSSVGGLIGYSNKTSVKESSSVGSVKGNLHANNYGGRDIGGFIGYLNEGSLDHVSSTSKVEGYGSTGGLIGISQNSSIIHAATQSTVSGKFKPGNTDNDSIGGLIGIAHGTTISTSSSSGTIQGDLSIGGLIGYQDEGLIENTYSMASVSGNYAIGGFIGSGNNIKVTHSYSNGKVQGNYAVGGFIANDNGTPTVISSYWDKDTSQQSSSFSGIGKTTSEMKQSSLYADWDRSYWKIVENQYPIIK